MSACASANRADVLIFVFLRTQLKGIALGAAVFVSSFFAAANGSAFEHRHAAGVGYQFAHVQSKTQGGYGLGSLPISYLGRYGGEWAALFRLSVLVPLRASDGENSFSPASEYERTQAYDSLLAANYRFTEWSGWHVEAGLGPHFNFTRFQDPEYVEWSSASLGLGAMWGARRFVGTSFWGGRPELGLQLDFSFDFIDLAHGGDFAAGLQGQALVSVGWAMGTRQ